MKRNFLSFLCVIKEAFLQKEKRLLLFVCFIVLVVFVFVVVLSSSSQEQKIFLSSPSEQKLVNFRHPLTGILQEEEMAPPFVYAVMLGNSYEAWPLSGLEKAFLVIEAPVEAYIPRLLAFFSEDQTGEKIGPVRSARPYYLDWANEFHALYVHVGGSNNALEKIASGGTFDLNEFFQGAFFWRSTERYAPHNTYTSSKLLAEFVKKRQEQGKAPEPLYEYWSFKEDSPVSEEGRVSGVHISFQNSFTDPYAIFWSYDQKTNQYERIQNGKEMAEESIWANNIVLLITEIQVQDAVGRLSIQTLGEGEAVIFQDGTEKKGTWKKFSEGKRLRFYDEQDKEIQWNAGTTWIEVLDDPGSFFVE